MAKYNIIEKKEKEAAYRSLVSPKMMDEMQEKILYIIAMIGALICFTGDILLGFFTPAPDFMNKYVGICGGELWSY
jgi:hypothetical protein